MKTYAILIKDSSLNSTGANLEQIMAYMPNHTMEYNYMIGFLDGYIMEDNYLIYGLSEFQIAINKSKKILDSRYLIFLRATKTTQIEECLN